jgi:hypothetical protein
MVDTSRPGSSRPNGESGKSGQGGQGGQGGKRGRGVDSAQVIVISWRDIPAQVNAQQGRVRHQVILSGKFQRAIDRAKRKAKIYTAHRDIAQWSRISRPCGPDLASEAQAEADRYEHRYTTEHLGRLGFLGGWEPENKPFDEILDETEDDNEEVEVEIEDAVLSTRDLTDPTGE